MMRQAMRKTQRGLVEDDRSHPSAPPQPPNRAPRAVVVMTRRAAFGASRDEIEARAAQGYDKTVEELLDPGSQPGS